MTDEKKNDVLDKNDALNALNTLKDYGLQEGRKGLKLAKKYGMDYLIKTHKAAAEKYEAAKKAHNQHNHSNIDIYKASVTLGDDPTIFGADYLSSSDYNAAAKVVGISKEIDPDPEQNLSVIKVVSGPNVSFLAATKDKVYYPTSRATAERLGAIYSIMGEMTVEDDELTDLTNSIMHMVLHPVSVKL